MSEIARAIRILRAGGLVAFPTETVYGLGADARSASAVAKIFAAKGRPPTNPLIVHVSGVAMARAIAGAWDERASALAERFWPGPLALVLPRSAALAPAVSAGRPSAALRCPDHPLALELLHALAGPIAAPSANRSNRISPTTADHVRQELGDRIDLILDGGPCRIGIESTVLDLCAPRAVLLRPGAVSRQEIEAQIGAVDVFSGSVDPAHAAASPGQHEIHYAPRRPAYRFTALEATAVAQAVAPGGRLAGGRCALLCLGPTVPEALAPLGIEPTMLVLQPGEGPEEYARRLYAALRELDQPGTAALFVEMPPPTPAWAAVNDRLRRAARPIAELGSRL